MTFRGLVWLTLFLLLPGALRAEAPAAARPTTHPLLWQLSSSPSSPPSFLYGTVHVPDPRVLALPRAVTRALSQADVVYTEVPMDNRTQQQIQRASLLPRGETLQTQLPPEVYQRTARYLKSRGYSIQLFFGQKIWALQVSLEMLDYLPEMAEAQPLDMYLAGRARVAGKRMDALETVEEQLEVLDGLSRSDQVEALQESLDQLEVAARSGTSPARKLVEAYLRGDADELRATALAMIDTSKPLNQRQLETLINQRNARMAERIERAVRAGPEQSHFFAVGALHYPGEQGILELLRARGLEIRRLQ